MQIQNNTPQTNFNGKLFINRAPDLVAKGRDLIFAPNGSFLRMSSREILNIDNGELVNTTTRVKFEGNPAVRYFLNIDGDVYKQFRTPIETNRIQDKSLRMISNQVSPKLDVNISNDSNVHEIVKILKDRGMIDRISVDNIKASRLFRKLEQITGEKIPTTPNQPKYFINCQNKMFLIADYTKDDKENGTIIKYVFDKEA